MKTLDLLRSHPPLPPDDKYGEDYEGTRVPPTIGSAHTSAEGASLQPDRPKPRRQAIISSSSSEDDVTATLAERQRAIRKKAGKRVRPETASIFTRSPSPPRKFMKKASRLIFL